MVRLSGQSSGVTSGPEAPIVLTKRRLVQAVGWTGDQTVVPIVVVAVAAARDKAVAAVVQDPDQRLAAGVAVGHGLRMHQRLTALLKRHLSGRISGPGLI